MAFWKKKKIKDSWYYYIYESYYEDGKSKQRMLEYIGSESNVLALAMEAFLSRRSSQKELASTSGIAEEKPGSDAPS